MHGSNIVAATGFSASPDFMLSGNEAKTNRNSFTFGKRATRTSPHSDSSELHKDGTAIVKRAGTR